MEGMINIVNRNEYTTFKRTPKLNYHVKRKIKKVQMCRVCYDEDYEKEKENGTLIQISNPEILVGGKKPIDGIFSAKFGTDSTQDVPFYSCNCGRLTGGAHNGRICPDCGSEVQPIKADLRKHAFIDIAPWHIMTFHGYHAIKKVIKNLDEIISSTRGVNLKGKVKDSQKYTIMSLYDNYDEQIYPLTGLPKKYAFTTKVPVYSARLRPLMMFGSAMSILKVNEKYLAILKANQLLLTYKYALFEPTNSLQSILNVIQNNFIEVTEIVNMMLGSKNGAIRKNMATGRLDYSSRMVISPGEDLRPYEVDIPYQDAMIIYEEEITNYLANIEGITRSEALSQVIIGQNVVLPKFIQIINALIREGIWVMINRNPTIKESGILYCKVRQIHKDTTDHTLHLPRDILELLGADYDGDQLTKIAVKNSRFHPYFMVMCPSYAFIDRATGYINRSMLHTKDYAAILAKICTIDSVCNDYLMSENAMTYNQMVQLGMDDYSECTTPEQQAKISERRYKIFKQLKKYGSDTMKARFDIE